MGNSTSKSDIVHFERVENGKVTLLGVEANEIEGDREYDLNNLPEYPPLRIPSELGGRTGLTGSARLPAAIAVDRLRDSLSISGPPRSSNAYANANPNAASPSSNSVPSHPSTATQSVLGPSRYGPATSALVSSPDTPSSETGSKSALTTTEEPAAASSKSSPSSMPSPGAESATGTTPGIGSALVSSSASASAPASAPALASGEREEASGLRKAHAGDFAAAPRHKAIAALPVADLRKYSQKYKSPLLPRPSVNDPRSGEHFSSTEFNISYGVRDVHALPPPSSQFLFAGSPPTSDAGSAILDQARQQQHQQQQQQRQQQEDDISSTISEEANTASAHQHEALSISPSTASTAWASESQRNRLSKYGLPAQSHLQSPQRESSAADSNSNNSSNSGSGNHAGTRLLDTQPLSQALESDAVTVDEPSSNHSAMHDADNFPQSRSDSSASSLSNAISVPRRRDGPGYGPGNGHGHARGLAPAHAPGYSDVNTNSITNANTNTNALPVPDDAFVHPSTNIHGNSSQPSSLKSNSSQQQRLLPSPPSSRQSSSEIQFVKERVNGPGSSTVSTTAAMSMSQSAVASPSVKLSGTAKAPSPKSEFPPTTTRMSPTQESPAAGSSSHMGPVSQLNSTKITLVRYVLTISFRVSSSFPSLFLALGPDACYENFPLGSRWPGPLPGVQVNSDAGPARLPQPVEQWRQKINSRAGAAPPPGQSAPQGFPSVLTRCKVEKMGEFQAQKDPFYHSIELYLSKSLEDRRFALYVIDENSVIQSKTRGFTSFQNDLQEHTALDQNMQRTSIERSSRREAIERLSKLDAKMFSDEPEEFSEPIAALSTVQRSKVQYLEAPDTCKLAFRWYSPGNHMPTQALFVFAASNSHFHDIVTSRLSENYPIACCVWEMRGYGYSGGERGEAPSKEQVWIDLRHFIRHLRANYPGVPVYVGGHYFQAGLILNYATWKDRSPADGYVFLSPQLGSQANDTWNQEAFDKLSKEMKSKSYVDNLFMSVITSGLFKGDRPIIQQEFSEKEYSVNPLLVDIVSPNIARACTPSNPRKQFEQVDTPFGFWVAENEELLIPQKLISYPVPSRDSQIKIMQGQSHLSLFCVIYKSLGDWIMNQKTVRMYKTPDKGTSSEETDTTRKITCCHKSLKDMDILIDSYRRLRLESVRPSFLLNSEGRKIAFKTFEPETPPINNLILIQSGLHEVAAYLISHKTSSTVYCVDIRGLGDPEIDIGNKENLMKDIRVLVRHLRLNSPDIPLMLGGHGYGACFVLNYAVWKAKQPVNGYMFISPVIDPRFAAPGDREYSLSRMETLRKILDRGDGSTAAEVVTNAGTNTNSIYGDADYGRSSTSVDSERSAPSGRGSPERLVSESPSFGTLPPMIYLFRVGDADQASPEYLARLIPKMKHLIEVSSPLFADSVQAAIWESVSSRGFLQKIKDIDAPFGLWIGNDDELMKSDKFVECVSAIVKGSLFEVGLIPHSSHMSTLITSTAYSCRWIDKFVKIVTPTLSFRINNPCLDDFERLEFIGRGSFGRVYLVRHKVSEKYFAMKILAKHDIVRAKEVNHVINERNILRDLNTSLAVSFICSFQDAQRLYIVMEYVIGGELFTLLSRRKRFTNEMARFYAAEVVLFFEEIHSKQVLYRDLKPENILLDSMGHIKITDFGFARYLRSSRTKTFCGTPQYISPEMILTAENPEASEGYGESVDFWALGVLIYEMLMGQTPFHDVSARAVYRRILYGFVELPWGMDPNAKDLIKKLLTRNVQRRIGCSGNGIEDIKRHKWFRGLDWNLLKKREIPAPYVPTFTHPGDTSNFIPYAKNMAGSVVRNETYGDIFDDF